MHKIRFFLGILFTIVVINVGLSIFNLQYKVESLKDLARLQARNSLESVAYCVKQEVKENGYSDTNLAIAINKCGGKLRSFGPTGDMFAVNMTTNQIIYDGSSDYNTGKPKYLDDKLCSLFAKPETCVSAIQELKKGYSSDIGNTLTWEFDDSKELLEWVIIPTDTEGFNGPVGLGGYKSKDNPQVLIALGTQTDELLSHCKTANIIDKITTYIYIILLFLLINMNYLLISNRWRNK